MRELFRDMYTVLFSTLLLPLWLYIGGPFDSSILEVPILTFIIGIIGTVFSYKNKNILVFIMCVETMLLSTVVTFLLLSLILMDVQGQLFALVILAVAAAETAIGLGLIVNAYRIHKTLDFVVFRVLRGMLLIPL